MEKANPKTEYNWEKLNPTAYQIDNVMTQEKKRKEFWNTVPHVLCTHVHTRVRNIE